MGTVRYTVIDGEVIAEKRNGVRKQYVPDSLGSTRALLDNTQTPTDTFTYWPYGEVASRTGTTPTPFQFVGTQGYCRDSSKNIYVRINVLNVTMGKWITTKQDKYYGNEINSYLYALDKPTNLIQANRHIQNFQLLNKISLRLLEDLMLIKTNCKQQTKNQKPKKPKHNPTLPPDNGLKFLECLENCKFQSHAWLLMWLDDYVQCSENAKKEPEPQKSVSLDLCELSWQDKIALGKYWYNSCERGCVARYLKSSGSAHLK